MKPTFNSSMQNLFDHNFTQFHDLENETITELTVMRIRETAPKLLPKLEDYDKSRELILMVASWMETENEDLGNEILQELSKLAHKAMEADIDDQFTAWNKRESQARIEAKRDLAQLVYSDSRQRI